jgi:hypothetical protein
MKRFMSMPNNLTKKSHPKRGFALVITLSLISFVFLLVITLISQIRMDLSYSDVRENQILAKAHARMGMMIAIGEIQKHLGPDMRVSTTADIYDERIDSGKKYYPENSKNENGFYPNDIVRSFLHAERTPYTLDQQNINEKFPLDNREGVDLDENRNIEKLPLGQRQWTGVWKHRGHGSDNYLDLEGGYNRLATRELPYNADKSSFISDSWLIDTSYDHHPAIEQAWLVSGNEGWQRKLAIMNKNQVVDFIEVPDGKYIDDEGYRVIPGSPVGAGNYGKFENAWKDHEHVATNRLPSNQYHHPLVDLGDPAGPENNYLGSEKVTWILKTPLLDELFDEENDDHQKNWKSYLVAEPVKVQKTAIHLGKDLRSNEEDQDWAMRSGTYAYWVGDEGVKAKVNIVEPFNLENGNVEKLIDSSSRLMVATEPNIQSGSFGFDFKIGSKIDDEQRRGLITAQSIQDLLEERPQTDVLAPNYFYHSMTTDSFGVLADLRLGGLKRDLSLAFIDDNKSKLWEKDFNRNWIYRDRVEALKNFPLFADQSKTAFGTDKIHKNQWFDSASDATVEDRDAMLAGPHWSVLADFHKKSTPSPLELSPPSQFPRMVGDNALIFDAGVSPKSRNGAFSPTADSKTFRFYNSFSDKYLNVVRPEPENHAIAPIMTRLRVTFYPMISNGGSDLEIAVNPSIVLWNPYNKPMRVENLYAYIPLSRDNENMGLKVRVLDFDPLEYDLFRKWWMYVSAEPKPRFILPGNTNGTKSKDYQQPWGLGPVGEYEAGLITSIFRKKWPERAPYGHEKDGFSLPITGGPPWVFKHDNPRISPDDDPGNQFWLMKEFRFWNTKGPEELDVIKSLTLKLTDTILQPGESISYTVDSNSPNEGKISESNHVVTMEPRGSELDAYIIQTDWEFKFGGIAFGYDGMYSINDSSDDSLKYDQGRFVYEKKPSVPSLLKWEGAGDFNYLNEKARLLYAYTYYTGDDFTNLALYTKGTLQKIWDNQVFLTHNYLPGYGFNLEVKLPGDRRSERILLNDFNLRHLVHSEQHGMGTWSYNADQVIASKVKDNRYLEHLPFSAGSTSFVVNHPDWNDSEGYQLTFNTPTSGGSEIEGPEDIGFPDFYDFDSNFPSKEDWLQQRQADYGALTTSELTSPDERANAIFGRTFNTASLTNDPEYPDNLLAPPNDSATHKPNLIEKANDGAVYPKMDNAGVRVGFFLDDQSFTNSGSPHLLTNVPGNQSADSNAVLFDVPEQKPLSILQYKHANLNTYLHGPSYALGNSYASTQVARHRAWGRVQTIQHEPTSARNLNAQMIAEMEEKQNIYLEELKRVFDVGFMIGHFYYHNWGPNGGYAYNYISHDIDFNRGLAAWRKNTSGSQLNHQNTTVDHSYYLNRALLDGYFLSGIAEDKEATRRDSTDLGEAYSPFLYNKNTKKSGNHRLVGFFRGGDWNESAYSQFDDQGSSSEKDDTFRYQSLAGDLLVNGAFNINSTSVDAWIAQLSSLRGKAVSRRSGTPIDDIEEDETPIIRFIEEPDQENSWNQLRKLTDKEIARLAKCMVAQVKLKGPFLSYSDFVNRRLSNGPESSDSDKAKGSVQNFVTIGLEDWALSPETNSSASGLRGAVQTAIADAGLNSTQSSGFHNWGIPQVPSARWNENSSNLNILSFGLHASSMQEKLWKGGYDRNWGSGTLQPGFKPGYNTPKWVKDADKMEMLGHGRIQLPDGASLPNVPLSFSGSPIDSRIAGYKFRPDKFSYDATEYGEAPENFLAVEDLATGANKPGWVMQADLLSPLAPVTSARSDTFTVRVLGESGSQNVAKAWIELVVQRTPDYVKADMDAPHHRPHEPFKDENLNGYWDNGASEEWIDLNRNGNSRGFPDLPGEESAKYRDGMSSDLGLQLDPQEEDVGSNVGMSFLGINQRFGRKFKIVRFRWLREDEV